MKLAEIFHVSMETLVGEQINICSKDSDEELRKIYQKLDEVNRTTLLVIGQRLFETQQDSIVERHTGDEDGKNRNM